MEGEASFSHITLPIFDGENYDLWEVKMQSYMESLDLWDAVCRNLPFGGRATRDSRDACSTKGIRAESPPTFI